MMCEQPNELPPDNPDTVERVIVFARQASIQFDGSFRFLRDGDYFEIVICAYNLGVL